MDQPAVDMPTMRMVMDIEGKDVTEDGDLRFSFKLTEADALDGGDPVMVEAIRSGLQSTVGMSGWALVDSRGITKDADFSLPAGADPEMLQGMESMKQSMNQMSAPLPEQPVGVGAVWKVKMPMEMNGLEVEQFGTYKLVSLVGGIAEMEITMEQNAGKQIMDLPGVPPEVIAELQSLKSTGSGRITVDLTKLVPTSELKMDMKMSAVMRMDTEEMPMSTRMKMDLEIRPRAVTESDEDEETDGGEEGD